MNVAVVEMKKNLDLEELRMYFSSLILQKRAQDFRHDLVEYSNLVQMVGEISIVQENKLDIQTGW